LVVGRQDVIQRTIELDRVAAPLQTVFNSMLQYEFMVGSLKYLADPSAATPALSKDQREALLKSMADFWSKVLARQSGEVLDEKMLREALLRALTPPATTKE